jgi:acyl carrier protein
MEIQKTLTDFIITNFLFGNSEKKPGDEESLIENGIIDSTGILELIQFLESTFEMHIEDKDILPSNLGSIANLTRFVTEKTAAR